jgi:HEPN domain-containing protein
MKAATREWIKKAESDWLLEVSLTRRRRPPVRDQACFLFQQSAEKYVKARMEEAGVRIPRIHQIDQLIQMTLGTEPLWAALMPAASRISDYAVRIRYPGNEATAAEMKRCHQDAKAIRQEARTALGL